MAKSWRDIAAPIIAQVIAEHRNEERATILKAISKAYPWGERAMWPYKVWLSEVHRQMGRESPDKHSLRESPDKHSLDLFADG